MKKVLITDHVHPLLKKGLEQRGFLVDLDDSMDMETLPKVIHQYAGLVINSKIKLRKNLIDQAPMLEFVCRLGSGMEIIDVDYCHQKGIVVINTPEGNCNAVAEHAMGMLLMLYNHLRRADAEVKQNIWHREKNRGTEISGKTIGIIGFGHTGSALAMKLKSWNATVIAHDKYKDKFGSEFEFVEQVDLQDILLRSDVISLHLPLTAETHHLVDEEFLEGMKQGAILINTSRGKVVQTNALLNALTSKKLSGACLDVFENEKPQTYSPEESNTYKKLFSLEQVVVSPHVAGWSHESLIKISETILKKLDGTNLFS